MFLLTLTDIRDKLHLWIGPSTPLQSHQLPQRRTFVYLMEMFPQWNMQSTSSWSLAVGRVQLLTSVATGAVREKHVEFYTHTGCHTDSRPALKDSEKNVSACVGKSLPLKHFPKIICGFMCDNAMLPPPLLSNLNHLVQLNNHVKLIMLSSLWTQIE